jgi:hypothetical protein
LPPADAQAAQHAPTEVAAEPVEDTVSVGYSVLSYQAATYQLNYGALALANQIWFSPGVEVAAGFRVGFGARLEDGYCFEGFGAVGIVPHFLTILDDAGRSASWRPSIGLELGLTTANFVSTLRAPGSGFSEGGTSNGVYGAFATRPLRFRLTRFNANVLGITFGTMMGHVGQVLRIQIELLQIGVVL